MNREEFSGNLRSYNGEGRWSVEAVRDRYREYCMTFHVEHPRQLSPREHREGDVHWIYPIMDEVIANIDEGDPACVALGIDFIEEDALFPFGATLKSNTARALRRAQLSEQQKARVRERVVHMLISGIIPREMREYVKLLRTIGVCEQWARLEIGIPRENRYAMRFYRALRAAEGLPLISHAE
jgi:hypothetical protein